MALVYEPSAPGGPIRQAELLSNVEEYQVELDDQGSSEALGFIRVEHPLVVVVSQDCDLEQDFNLRHPAGDQVITSEEADARATALPYVLMCEGYGEEELGGHLPDSFGSKDFRRIRQNQNERYHCLEEGRLGSPEETIEPLFFDFRRHFSLPSAGLYGQLDRGQVARRGRVPVYHLHDLVHRFFGYLSRVAIL